MDSLDLAHRRVHNQHLLSPLPDPVAVVRHFGAMQAQEFAIAKWSVGQRGAGFAEVDVQRALDDGTILRTHALRPTWHFVAAVDLGWIQALTGPRVHGVNGHYYRQWGLNDDVFARAHDVFTATLAGQNFRTRPELAAGLAAAGIEATGNRLAYLVLHAELMGLIASGPVRGKQHTYALIRERVSDPITLEPDEALAELVRRYFTSHGPATVKDLRWWSSLTLAQIRRGIALAGTALTSETVNGREYFFAPAAAPTRAPSPTVHLLQGYDECIVAYTESRDLLNLAGLVIRAENENTLIHSIVVDSQVVGHWRRVVERAGITAEVTLATALTAKKRRAVQAAFDRFATFAGLPVMVRW